VAPDQLRYAHLRHGNDAEQPHTHVGLIDIIATNGTLNLPKQGDKTEVVSGQGMNHFSKS